MESSEKNKRKGPYLGTSRWTDRRKRVRKSMLIPNEAQSSETVGFGAATTSTVGLSNACSTSSTCDDDNGSLTFTGSPNHESTTQAAFEMEFTVDSLDDDVCATADQLEDTSEPNGQCYKTLHLNLSFASRQS